MLKKEIIKMDAKRIGVIGIVVKGDRSVSMQLQQLLSFYGDNIIGRMGLPDAKSGIYVISIIFKGSNEQFSSFTGKIGRLQNVNVKSAITSVEIP
ncbi:MAG: CopG family transcriptional regulator [Clostridia bacterium]|nr:CopG family transcriptional regulator [Clostridia bacterium]